MKLQESKVSYDSIKKCKSLNEFISNDEVNNSEKLKEF